MNRRLRFAALLATRAAAAQGLLQERAAAIQDARLRQSFLENVPAHRVWPMRPDCAPATCEDVV